MTLVKNEIAPRSINYLTETQTRTPKIEEPRSNVSSLIIQVDVLEDSVFDLNSGLTKSNIKISYFDRKSKVLLDTQFKELTPESLNINEVPEVLKKTKISQLNPIQLVFFTLTKNFKNYFKRLPSFLISSPTSSGKTANIYMYIDEYLKDSKAEDLIIYTVPLRALAYEKYNEMRSIYGDLVQIRTGETLERDIKPDTRILVCTPELITLAARNNVEYIERVSSIIIDEVHIIYGNRGLVIDELLYLTKEHSWNFLLISATIPKLNDLANFMNTDILLLSKWTPVKVEKIITSVREQKNKYYTIKRILDGDLTVKKQLIAQKSQLQCFFTEFNSENCKTCDILKISYFNDKTIEVIFGISGNLAESLKEDPQRKFLIFINDKKVGRYYATFLESCGAKYIDREKLSSTEDEDIINEPVSRAETKAELRRALPEPEQIQSGQEEVSGSEQMYEVSQSNTQEDKIEAENEILSRAHDIQVSSEIPVKEIPIKVAVFNSDLDPQEKQILDHQFRNEDLNVLITTSSLAYGVNLPADHTIIYVTERVSRIKNNSDKRKKKSDRENNLRITYFPNVIDCIQMAGRAGRFGIKDKGICTFVLKGKYIDRFKRYISDINSITITDLVNILKDGRLPVELYLDLYVYLIPRLRFTPDIRHIRNLEIASDTLVKLMKEKSFLAGILVYDRKIDEEDYDDKTDALKFLIAKDFVTFKEGEQIRLTRKGRLSEKTMVTPNHIQFAIDSINIIEELLGRKPSHWTQFSRIRLGNEDKELISRHELFLRFLATLPLLKASACKTLKTLYFKLEEAEIEKLIGLREFSPDSYDQTTAGWKLLMLMKEALTYLDLEGLREKLELIRSDTVFKEKPTYISSLPIFKAFYIYNFYLFGKIFEENMLKRPFFPSEDPLKTDTIINFSLYLSGGYYTLYGFDSIKVEFTSELANSALNYTRNILNFAKEFPDLISPEEVLLFTQCFFRLVPPEALPYYIVIQKAIELFSDKSNKSSKKQGFGYKRKSIISTAIQFLNLIEGFTSDRVRDIKSECQKALKKLIVNEDRIMKAIELAMILHYAMKYFYFGERKGNEKVKSPASDARRFEEFLYQLNSKINLNLDRSTEADLKKLLGEKTYKNYEKARKENIDFFTRLFMELKKNEEYVEEEFKEAKPWFFFDAFVFEALAQAMNMTRHRDTLIPEEELKRRVFNRLFSYF